MIAFLSSLPFPSFSLSLQKLCAVPRHQNGRSNKTPGFITFAKRRASIFLSASPLSLQSLCTKLRDESSQKARLLKLTTLADQMPLLDEMNLNAETRVRGCNSVTHVGATTSNDGTVVLRGYSDALISKGLLALIVLGLNGATVAEIRQLSAEEIATSAGLEGGPLSSRAGGLAAILKTVQGQVCSSVDRPLRHNEVPDPTIGMPDYSVEQPGDDVAVLLSGGVDSSVALRLAQEHGARVHAFYLKIWLDDETAHMGACPWEEDLMYAREVCKQAGVTLHDVPFQQAYWDRVVSYVVEEARKGRTPNPDIMCNSRIKFGAFYEQFGRKFKSVVSGHYARKRVSRQTGLAEMWLSADEVKDQTYFLAHLRQEQLAKAWFPLGELNKLEVRQLASKYNLANKDRKDSQGICFLGKLKFDDFLGHHLGQQIGPLVEFESGRELGKHKGYWFFTVGQRRGIGLSGGPWHVVAKDIERNIVYISREYNSEDKERRCFDFDSASWISGDWPSALKIIGSEMILHVKTRHGKSMHDAVVYRTGEHSGHVELLTRDKGLAAGQFAAFYDDNGQCHGAGIIAGDASLQETPVTVIPSQLKSRNLQAHL